MNKIIFSVFQKATDLSQLRLLDGEGKLLGQRDLDNNENANLLTLVEAYYRRDAMQLTAIGKLLYGWLDGPTERWLELVAQNADGTAAVNDEAER